MFFSLRKKYKLLSRKEIEKIHRTSLKILTTIGVRIPHKKILEFLSERCQVNFSTGVVKFPLNLIEEVLASIKRSFKKPVFPERLEIKGAVGGFTPAIWDPEKGRRPPSLADAEKALRIGNQLPQVAFNGLLFNPMDCLPYQDIWGWAISLTRSIKPSGCWLLTPDSLKVVYQMCCVAVGEKEFKRKPLFGYACFLSSPLRYPEDALEMAWEAFQMGLPVNFGAPMTIPGGTGPIHLAGTLTLSNAETISGWVLNYLFQQPITRYDACPVVMDMRTGCGNYAHPQAVAMNAAVADISRFYGLLPEGGHLGDTDAPLPGIKAAWERVFTSLVSLMVNETGKISFRIGVLGPAGSCGCLEQMIIDAEIAEALNQFFRGIQVDEEKIAYPLIEKVGIGGNYLLLEETIKEMRKELYIPEILSLSQNSTFGEELNRAREKLNALLKTPCFHPLAADKEKEIFSLAEKFTGMKKSV